MKIQKNKEENSLQNFCFIWTDKDTVTFLQRFDMTFKRCDGTTLHFAARHPSFDYFGATTVHNSLP